MGFGWHSIVDWFNSGEKPHMAKKEPAPALQQWGGQQAPRPGGRVPGQVSAQTYSLSTGKPAPRGRPPILQSRLASDNAETARRTRVQEEQRRAEANKPVGPELNRTNRALLEALGWTVPGAQPLVANAMIDDWLDTGKGRDLAEYQYSVERPELELLQMATKGKRGVVEGEDLAAGERLIGSSKVRAVPLTQEAYKNLSADQKRAVDLNTMFVEAREKDLALKDEEGRGSTYDKAIEEMFGKEGGSTRYAPSTVDLLGKIGYKAQGQDLDEYLSLGNLVGLDELQNFKFTTDELKQGALTPRSQTGVKQYIDVRSTANQLLAQEQLVEQAGAYIDQALTNPQVWDVPSAAVFSASGAPPTGSTVPWGFGTAADRLNAQGTYDNPVDETLDQDVRDAYTFMQNPENDISRFWTTANDLGMDEDSLQKAFNYFDIQSRKDAESGTLAAGQRTPQEMRALFGLGGLE